MTIRILINTGTEKALKKSIVKWQKIHDKIKAGKDYDWPDRLNCPLCRLFNDEQGAGYSEIRCCNGCPIRIATGRRFCNETPYANFAGDLASAKNAAREVKFLQKLLDICLVRPGCENGKVIAWF